MEAEYIKERKKIVEEATKGMFEQEAIRVGKYLQQLYGYNKNDTSVHKLND